MALSFAREDGVAIDKPAGEACPNLQGGGACGIYGERAAKGFGFCIRYECFGAGQRVTQELFGGRNWRDDPALIRPMMDAFAHMRAVHDALVLMKEGRKLPLSDADMARFDVLERQLNPPDGWTQTSLQAAPTADWAAEITAILRRAYAQGARAIFRE